MPSTKRSDRKQKQTKTENRKQKLKKYKQHMTNSDIGMSLLSCNEKVDIKQFEPDQ